MWLAILFAAYIAVAVLFAGAYYALFLRQPASFMFNSDIQATQSRAFLASAGIEASSLRQQLEAHQELLPELQGLPRDLQDGESVASLRFRLLASRRRTIGAGNAIEILSWEILSKDGVSVERWEGPLDLLDRTDRIRARLREVERRIRSADSSSPEVWSFADFLYFSVIVQATVGFGDILPNSTLVRMIVVTQILVGLGILGVAINVVLPHLRKPGK